MNFWVIKGELLLRLRADASWLRAPGGGGRSGAALLYLSDEHAYKHCTGRFLPTASSSRRRRFYTQSPTSRKSFMGLPTARERFYSKRLGMPSTVCLTFSTCCCCDYTTIAHSFGDCAPQTWRKWMRSPVYPFWNSWCKRDKSLDLSNPKSPAYPRGFFVDSYYESCISPPAAPSRLHYAARS